ncbi:MAG: excinuclease ABC subunit UvrA, partial [Bacteroidota bacterium]
VQALILNGGGERIYVEHPEWGGRHTTFEGVLPNLYRRYDETQSERIREEMEGYMTERPCTECQGKRLRPESLAVTVGGKSIHDVACMPLKEARAFLLGMQLSPRKAQIAAQILKEIGGRLLFLLDVGLEYLTLGRSAGTLSGGEAQRIRLATQIGSGLVGVLYVLDEPSIGLHPRDNSRLLKTLQRLRDLGNTLIVVEHDEETIRTADHLVDIGPGAGVHGGRIVAQGTVREIEAAEESLTGDFLSGRRMVPVPAERRPGNGQEIKIEGASLNNLKNLSLSIPLGRFVCLTGVSGSGKSTLMNEVLYPHLHHHFHRGPVPVGAKSVTGFDAIDKVIVIDQSPIGRTPRSNPATYTGLFDTIRELFANSVEAKARGYLPGRFSFNVKGGRCEACAGEGVNRIEMHFLPDVYVPCEVCKGKRYNRETLEIKYKGKNIAEVLEMTVKEALEFFSAIPKLATKLRTLSEVGLDYITLGQPATTLSGGEAQRVKLATELSRRATTRTLYLLDEPTTGLHFADVDTLLQVLHRLVDNGNTVICIEHNLDVIKTADTIIDLGPEGGDEGGRLVVQGTPEEVARCEESHTGAFLIPLLKAKTACRCEEAVP